MQLQPVAMVVAAQQPGADDADICCAAKARQHEAGAKRAQLRRLQRCNAELREPLQRSTVAPLGGLATFTQRLQELPC